MKNAIESITIRFENGVEFTISRCPSQQAIQNMLDEYWRTVGTGRCEPCPRESASES